MKPCPAPLTGLCLLLLAGFANAQECVEDDECAPNERCDRRPQAGEAGEESSGPSSEEASDAIPAEPEELASGICERGARSCIDNAECPTDYECLFDQIDQACSSDGECGGPTQSEVGRCYHKPYTCNEDVDCPEGAVCGDSSECVLRLAECEEDSQCDEKYTCVSLRGGGSDSSSPAPNTQPPVTAEGPSGSSAEMPEGSEPLPQPVEPSTPEEPEVEQDSSGTCFPKPDVCQTDVDCGGGWVCVEADDGPPSWDGLDKTCLPLGVAAAMAGELHVEGGGTGVAGEHTSNDRGEESDGVSRASDVEDESDLVGAGSNSPADDLGTQGGSEGALGCNMRRNGQDSPWLGLSPLAALALGLWRRRRDRR